MGCWIGCIAYGSICEYADDAGNADDAGKADEDGKADDDGKADEDGNAEDAGNAEDDGNADDCGGVSVVMNWLYCATDALIWLIDALIWSNGSINASLCRPSAIPP